MGEGGGGGAGGRGAGGGVEIDEGGWGDEDPNLNGRRVVRALLDGLDVAESFSVTVRPPPPLLLHTHA